MIREAVSSDIPTLLNLLYELGRPSPVNSDVHFEKLLNQYMTDNDKLILVYTEDEKILGMASVVYLTRLNYATAEMYIPELVVAEVHRKMGIGKSLTSHLIHLAKQKECHRIRLESGVQRKESHEFYEKMGFTQNSLSFEYKINH